MSESILARLDRIDRTLHSIRLTVQEYLSFDEAAKYLKLSKSTLYKHTSAGNIAHYKPNGKLILFKRKDLDCWLARSRIPSNYEIRDTVK
jgi:excisionase family DNA binding protein